MPAMYYPFNQNPTNYLFLTVRTAGAPTPLLPLLVTAVHQVDPGLGVRNEATMAQRIDDSETAYLHRASSWLVGGFAAWLSCSASSVCME